MDYSEACLAMVREQVEARGVRDLRTLAAMRRVPREAFVPPGLLGEAYGDHALSIGRGQTISQPYIVGLMTEAAGPEPGRRILEVGTGSGYQAAVLAEAGAEVWTVERDAELAEAARRRLEAWPSVRARTGDGRLGWPEEAPYDAIVVTASAEAVPKALPGQLAPGGRLVIPVAGRLLRIAPDGAEAFLEHVRFVPLI